MVIHDVIVWPIYSISVCVVWTEVGYEEHQCRTDSTQKH